MSNVGWLIRTARLRRGRSQTDLAAAIGKSLGYVCDIERGRRLSTPKTLRAIAAVLAIDETLLYDTFVQDATEAARHEWLYTGKKGEVSNNAVEYRLLDDYANAAN